MKAILDIPMAEKEEAYLRECRDRGLCPACQQPIKSKLGSGQFGEGVFCSLGCYGDWHEGVLRRRHAGRLGKEDSNE